MTTPIYSWPYPASGDEVDVPQDIQDLALAIETDLDALADTVAGLPGGGGGGGGSTASAHYTAGATAQSIPTTTDTVVAFGTEADADALVVRTTQGAGHKFALQTTGIWAISTTVRYATNPAGGERAVSLRTVGGLTLAHAGGAQPGLPATYALSCTRSLAEDTEIIVVAYQGTGGSRDLEPNSGAWVQISLALVG